MSRARRILLLFLIMTLVIAVDQATKAVAVAYLRGREPIIYLNDMARLLYAENSGAFLSLGAQLPDVAQQWVFVGAVTVVLVGLLVYALKEIDNLNTMLLAGFGLILGGGIGNLIDRVVNDGHVVDFMNVGIGRLRTGIFNVADMALMAGVGMVLIYSLRMKESEHAEPAEQAVGE